MNQTIYLRLGEERPAWHHRVELSARLVLTFGDCQRDLLCAAIWDKVKRVRASVRGNYGDDSTQYELVGGTRLSDRKPRARKVTTTE